MRPTWDYRDDGATAFFDNKTENDNPHPEQSLAHFQWLQGFIAEQVMVLQDEDPFKGSDRSTYLEDVKYWVRQQASRLKRELPSAEDVAQAINVDLREWPANCYAIAKATLESGILDEYQEKHGKLFLTYGHYHGHISPTSIFAKRPFARHGWLESTNGHVVDPTRYVFHGGEPEIWAGSIEDYDMSGARLRERMAPSPPEVTDSDLVKLPLNDPSSLAVFDRIMRNRNREVEKSSQIELAHLRWVVNRPVAEMGDDAPMILRTIDMIGKPALMPVDTRNWISEVSEWRENSAQSTFKP